jgi:hypothetical protein
MLFIERSDFFERSGSRLSFLQICALGNDSVAPYS